MSTANDYANAKNYAQGKVVYKISLPKGAKAARMADLSPMGDYEYTIQRDSHLKITRVTPTSGGILLINAKYI